MRTITTLLLCSIMEPTAFCAGFQGLGDLQGGRVFSKANAVSADGSVVVGETESEFGNEAFRWENGLMTGLGDLSGGLLFPNLRQG